MAHVLAIFGSPRKDGNTSRLHDAFLDGLGPGNSIRRVYAYDLAAMPCTDCGYCRDDFSCVHHDEMNLLYDEINGCGLLSVSSPLYFSSLPSPLKAIVDRCQVLWELSRRDRAAIKKKTGFFIAAGGGEYPGMFTPAVITMRHFFNTVGCGFREEEYILSSGLEGVGGNLSPEILNRAKETGVIYSRLIDKERQ